MPVFSTTSRATRSGCSTHRWKPIGPPQSCTTTVRSRRSSSVHEPLDRAGVCLVRVPIRISRLVRAAEAEVVRRNATRSAGELADHFPVEERPRRLAVEKQHRVAGADVDVVHPQAVLVEVARLEVPPRQVHELRIRRAIGVDRILLPDDDRSLARPMIERPRAPSLPHMRGGAMPTYAIHQISVLAAKPVPRPKGARRIAMSARKASIVQRRTQRRAA